MDTNLVTRPGTEIMLPTENGITSVIWELMKTENGIILACFFANILSISIEDLKNTDVVCTILCSLFCSVILGGIIASICPKDIKPYIAITLIVVSGFGAVYRMLEGGSKNKKSPFFSVKYTTNCGTTEKNQV